MVTPQGRRELKKQLTSWDKFERPVIRLNFTWQYLRLQFIQQVAEIMDISLEAFIRFAAYERAIKVLAEESAEPITYKRVLSNRYRRRVDTIGLNWRWRGQHLNLINEAAKKVSTDFKTFIDIAAFEKAVQIDQLNLNEKTRKKLESYVNYIKDDTDNII